MASVFYFNQITFLRFAYHFVEIDASNYRPTVLHCILCRKYRRKPIACWLQNYELRLTSRQWPATSNILRKILTFKIKNHPNYIRKRPNTDYNKFLSTKQRHWQTVITKKKWCSFKWLWLIKHWWIITPRQNKVHRASLAEHSENRNVSTVV